MKAIIVKNTPADIDGGIEIPVTRICADSAIGRDAMPLFVPDIPLGWYARICPALRISRLGKHIPARFVPRYIDSVTAVCLLCATDDRFITSGLSAIIDNSVTVGRYAPWVPDSPAPEIVINGKPVKINMAAADPAPVVSAVSTFTTLKSGDLIIFEDLGADLPLTPDTHITAEIGDISCLNLKVK